jgi:glutamate-1-semialdehyde 2,1-aminomutase
MEYLAIIQARLGSSRLPNKVMQTVGGVPMVKRVFNAASNAWVDKAIVAWPERYPDLDENDVLGRFQRLATEFNPTYIIRLTADCPLLTAFDIKHAIFEFNKSGRVYYNNRRDGHDVQIFRTSILFDGSMTDKEHVIKDSPNVGGTSVNTKWDLYQVRHLAR